jgi:hypothetical protein
MFLGYFLVYLAETRVFESNYLLVGFFLALMGLGSSNFPGNFVIFLKVLQQPLHLVQVSPIFPPDTKEK